MHKPTTRLPIYLLLCIFLASCAAIATHQFDQLYGEERVQERVLSEGYANNNEKQWPHPEYTQDIKPIFDSRCVVCHGCYDAPCQLKMTSHEAIDRGANKDLVYDGARIISQSPTRMFEDAASTLEWRDKGFFPVLNERDQSPEVNLIGSTLYRMLELKNKHPLPESKLLDDSFDLSLNRNQECSTIETFDNFAENKPLWGMPYGLPAIEEDQFNLVSEWIKTGAKSLPHPELNKGLQEEVSKWEKYLNGDSLKERLVSRYIFEHLYLANLYFAEASDASRPQFFKLVRSRTPSGTDIQTISTRRPFDSPGKQTFYYRLRPVHSTILDKTNMPYRLNQARMDRWTELFYESDYQVTKWPGYKAKVAANPFDAFEQLPVKSRYKFMLDEAQYTISGFIKGPVCRGQIALNVIRDHFWVAFIDPDNEHMSDTAKFISREKDYLRMPAEYGSDGILPIASWVKYSLLQKEYNEARTKFINKLFPTSEEISIELIWNGDGHNQNAGLTVFRHFDSATVLKGHHGKKPLTTWLIGYSLLERIHYLLVAGFDVYGNVSHQLMTRLYMDFLRMEAESNFLNFLPKDAASAELARWNLNALNEVKVYSELLHSQRDGARDMSYRSDVPKAEFLDMLHKHLGEQVLPPDSINRPRDTTVYAKHIRLLQKLANHRGAHLLRFPEQILLRVKRSSEKDEVYTILNNVSHTNVAHIFGEDERVLANEQSISVLPGIVGSYPNVFLNVHEDQLAEFVTAFDSVSTGKDYEAFLDRYGIRRTSPEFWSFSDWIHDWYLENAPIESGYLDFNRLENR
jgi:hypothetical protein